MRRSSPAARGLADPDCEVDVLAFLLEEVGQRPPDVLESLAVPPDRAPVDVDVVGLLAIQLVAPGAGLIDEPARRLPGDVEFVRDLTPREAEVGALSALSTRSSRDFIGWGEGLDAST